MSDLFGEEPPAVLFDIAETRFEGEGCLQGEGCDPVTSLRYVEHEPITDLRGEVCPAVLICRGLREATNAEQADMGQFTSPFVKPGERVCDLRINFVRPDQIFPS